MYVLRLYHENDPAKPVDARLFDKGSILIGRDPSADWVIADPERQVSRKHCEVIRTDRGLALRSLGANGIAVGEEGVFVPTGETVEIDEGARFFLGRFQIGIDTAPQSDQILSDMARTMIFSPPLGNRTDIPADWADPLPGSSTAGSGSLLDAFCEGAGLDASAFAADDPIEIIHRAGSVYRQMVLGLGDMMAERDKAKAALQLNRTTIAARGNNPFKWAPTQRLAVDLLKNDVPGFLSGPAAVRASFEDLKRHLFSTFAGFQGSLKVVMDIFSPASIEQGSDRNSFLQSRFAALWKRHEELHRTVSEEIAEKREGALDQAFRSAYDLAERAAAGAPR